jgi:hypothetical protein
LRTIIEKVLRPSRGLAERFVLSSRTLGNHLTGFVDESAVIVVQAARPGNGKRSDSNDGFELVNQLMIMEALPMIAPKQVAGGMEFLLTVGLSAVAGLLAFLLVSLVVNVLGLSGG